MRNFSKSITGIWAGMALGALILLPFHYKLLGKDATPPPTMSVDASPVVRNAQAVTSWAPVVKRVAPSIVNIYSTTIVHFHMEESPFFNDPFFRQFFGNQFPFPGESHDITRKEESLGSGIIVSSDGYILTANHVISGANVVKVALSGSSGKEYTARIIGSDPRTDVAVLKINATGLPAATLGDSGQLEIGDVVLAIGNPFGLGQTVTMGIVSALGRHGYHGLARYQDYIQTDAAINPGNSGGALVDAEGRLVGINDWIASRSGGSEGIGFAVPINLARNAMDSLIAHGRVIRGYLGITLEDVTPALAQGFDYPKTSGAVVGGVLPDSPAARAGLKDGDIITELNGKPVADADSLTLDVTERAPGTEVKLTLFRDGKNRTLTVRLGELPEAETARQSKGGQYSTSSTTTDALSGVTVEDLNQDARDQLKMPDSVKGVLVVDVDPNSNAAAAGLQVNDVVTEINRSAITNTDQAVKLCEQAKGRYILLKIWRREGDFSGTTYLSVDNRKQAE
ncbi:MAG: DegQ family serine endoprotease [Verrucomicrobiota bacterium]|nr:DegQ family serine endoprotease [Verrucomicrobiota bacterium]